MVTAGPDAGFWKDRRVFLTGHTGFKGSWMCLWLGTMGARVTGYSLPPPTDPNMFESCGIGQFVDSRIADIRDLPALRDAMRDARPEIIFHMAAQPLVRESYRDPVGTFSVNVMGTVNLLDAARHAGGIRAIVNVTTDKCYENREWVWGYRENEPLGGNDPYSGSKACSELVTAAYRSSFLAPRPGSDAGVAVATARAGNVIGGGDWAEDRLVPDCIRAFLSRREVRIRKPGAIRPWQHVLEPLCGYLVLAEKLYGGGPEFPGGWNFGPRGDDARSVEWLVRSLCRRWGPAASYGTDPGEHPHEAHSLTLDCSKAKAVLGWSPRWDIHKALDLVVEWYRAHGENGDLREICLRQIREYERDGKENP